MDKKVLNTVWHYIVTVILAAVMALNYEILIFGNSFAPAGINGLATLIQYSFKFSVGYMSLLINVPLLVVALIFVDRDFVFKTATFVVVYSVAILLLKNGNGDDQGVIDVGAITYYTGVASKILAPVASGAINGLIYGVTIKMNGSTGGTDIIARLVRVRHPELNIMWVMFALNSVVAVLSFFVYSDGGYNLEPVILCILYAFIASKMGDAILKGSKNALKFEVVTSHPEEISREIIEKLNHSATVVHATGMFSHTDKDLLICVVRKSQIIEFEKIVKKYPETFAYLSSVNEVVGNFVNRRPGKSK